MSGIKIFFDFVKGSVMEAYQSSLNATQSTLNEQKRSSRLG